MDRFSFLNAAHSQFIEDLYQQYLKYPDSIEPSWKSFFQGFDFALANYSDDEVSITQLASNVVATGNIPENIEKFCTDNLSLLFRVNNAFKLFKENITAVNSYKIHIEKACKCLLNKIAFIFTH